MFDLQIVIRDRSRNDVYDPEATTMYAGGIRFATNAPGGYADCSINLRRSDTFASWAIKDSYQVQIFNGLVQVYEGDIIDIDRKSDGSVTLNCSGRQWVFGERELVKIWADDAAVSNMSSSLDNSDPPQEPFQVQTGDTYIRANFAGIDTRDSTDAEDYQYTAEYDTRGLGIIRRIEGTLESRCGEGVQCQIYNVDQSSLEATISRTSATQGSTSMNTTLSGGATEAVKFILGPSNDNAEYTQDDWMNIQSLTILCHYHASHPNYSSPSYTSKQLLIDILYESGLAGDTISEDFDDISDPGLTIKPFGGRETKTVASLIDDVVAFGDSSDQTYIWYIWGSAGTSDDLPIMDVSARDVGSYEYIIDSRHENVVSMDITYSGRRLKNYYRVKYIGTDGRQYLRTPDDDSALKNQTSIDADFQRDRTIDVRKSTASLASQIGQTQLAKFSTRRLKGKIEVDWEIKRADGSVVPACWVRAGERVYLPELDETIFIGSTDYDADTGRLTITPDEPPDTLESILARNELSYVDK